MSANDPEDASLYASYPYSNQLGEQMERTISQERYRPPTSQFGRRRRLVRERWVRPVTLRPKRHLLVRKGVIDHAPGGGLMGQSADSDRVTTPPSPVGRDQSRPYASSSGHYIDSDPQFKLDPPSIEQQETIAHVGTIREAVHGRGDSCGRPGGDGRPVEDGRPGGDGHPVEDGHPDPPAPDENKAQEAVIASFPYWIESLYAVEYPTTVRKVAHTHRFVRKQRRRSVQDRRRLRFLRYLVIYIVVVALLLVVLVPSGAGLAAYNTYNTIRSVALDGVDHLLAVKTLVPISKSDPTAALNTQKLQQAQIELNEAEGDFTQVQQLVNRPDVQSAIQQFAPDYGSKLGMAQRLVQVGLDVSRMGNEMLGVALLAASILHGSPLASSSTKPLITAADIANAEGAMVHALYYINDIRTQMSQVSMKDLPISAAQKTQLSSVLGLLPRVQNMIEQVQGVSGIASWLLGVGHERRFLVQTMDSAELRPGGGFTGQYGILQISDGSMAPFSLQDVTELDYAGNGTATGRSAPPGYSWMRFGNWGVRDSNLSGDFPTTARMTMQVFQDEGGGPIDGDIAFTPALIKQILDVVGAIRVPGYNETITSKNLEERLHYYQQNYSAIALQRQKSGTNNAATRKTFTTLLGRLLLERVRHLQVKQLLAIMQSAVKDLQSRDLEIYFTNPLAEAWLVQHGYSGAMDTFNNQDGFMLVQANISISKASQYVHTTEQDKVTLDAQGGATHALTITLNYKQTGPVYGYDTYADYIRVYTPPNAQFIFGDGFDSGHCLSATDATGSGSTCCTSNTCGSYNSSFPSSARYCPDGNYSLGERGYLAGIGLTSWPIDSLGPPTAFTSDLPGRSMWGGLTETPKNCISYITLSWYVPHVVKNAGSQSPYSLLLQKQGGYIPTVQITIDTSASPGKWGKSLSFNGDLLADRVLALPGPTKS